MVRLLFSLLLLLSFQISHGEPVPAPLPPPLTPITPPPLPEQDVTLQEELENMPEPEVRIVKRPHYMAEEYRVNGRLYLVKITPRNAPPYYLSDMDGDGYLESRHDDLSPDFRIPRWVLFRW